jgi:hypothetical protein
MNMIDRELSAVKKIADLLTPHGIHVSEARTGSGLTGKSPLTISGVTLSPGDYATLELVIYVPLEAVESVS